MTELDTATPDSAETPAAPATAGLGRRSFMNRLFLTSGAAAVATMTGIPLAVAAPGASPSPSASPAPGASSPGAGPTRGPGTGGGVAAGQSITEDFFGLTTDGRRIDDLFSIHSRGVDTAPVTDAGKAFLAGLTDTQRAKVQFSVRSTEWRTWSNLDPGEFPRQGVSLADLDETQKNLATALLRAALSADGLQTTENIRRINLAAGQAVGNSTVFNDVLYYFTLMGTPSATEPWGFQLDGHHLVVNYFVLGHQVVMSPSFWGTEPTSTQIAGETVTACQAELDASLAFISSLSPAQRKVAVVSTTKSDEDMKAGAFTDNAAEPYTGIRATALSKAQQRHLLAVVEVFVDRAKADVAKVRMAEIRQHLTDTYATWYGGTGAQDPFYLQIHSPVVWVEVDCQAAGPLGGAYGKTRADGPTRQHVHSVIRTPNGNDYGRELLREHYATSPHHHV